MRDVVDMFGTNFTASMEVVFTTLEHTIRLLQATGREDRSFSIADLKAKRTRLIQAVAVVLEESLASPSPTGRSSHIPKVCTDHARFVRDCLQPGDVLITFNYDCVIDYALRAGGTEKWNARYGYGFKLGPRGSALEGDEHWQPQGGRATKANTVRLLKLHGSLNFNVTENKKGVASIRLKQRPYTRQKGNMQFTIIPPEWHKAYDSQPFRTLWKYAAEAIYKAEELAFIGYSLPPTDMHATALFRTSVHKGRLRSLVVVNPDQEARKRTRTIVQRGLSADSRVLSFNELGHFLALSEEVWRRPKKGDVTQRAIPAAGPVQAPEPVDGEQTPPVAPAAEQN